MLELGPKVKLFALDIETVSQGKRANDYTDNKHYRLGNTKDPAKVEAKLKEKREEARTKHALNWWTGKVVSVALVDCVSDKAEVFNGHDEASILSQLAECLNSFTCKLIGKTSKNFDFPFLIGRYLANGMTPPKVLTKHQDLYDMDEFFGRSSASGQRGALADYSHGMGIEDKLMHGSEVAALYAEILMADGKGDAPKASALWAKLAAYNVDDSKKVAHAARLYWGLK
jgi:hypothetical protein